MDPNQLARVRLLPGYLRSCTWTYDANDVDAVLADYDRLTAEIAEHAEEVRVLRAGWDGEIAIATEAVNERDRLKSQLSKLHGTVRTYIDAPGQLRGECFRDMQETLLWIDGHDDLLGWPACHARVVAERAQLADIIAKLPQTADGLPVVTGMKLWKVWNGKTVNEIAAMVVDLGHVYMEPEMCYSTREAAEAAQAKGASDA